jgi:hypothetical protein
MRQGNPLCLSSRGGDRCAIVGELARWSAVAFPAEHDPVGAAVESISKLHFRNAQDPKGFEVQCLLPLVPQTETNTQSPTTDPNTAAP